MKIHYKDEKGRKYTIACVEEEMRAAASDNELYPKAIVGVFGHHPSDTQNEDSIVIEYDEGEGNV